MPWSRTMLAAPTIRRMTWRLPLALGMAVLAMLLSGCGDEREVVFSTDAAPSTDDRPAMLADIAALAKGRNLADPDNAKRYHDAVDALIGRGARIEPTLIETLAGNDDWAVRLGAVEVLKAVGTRRCIEPLMGALEDSQPLVALNADYLLRALTKHQVIPQAGDAPVADLPPVPKPAPGDLALDTEEKLWSAWHRDHHVALHQAWRTWWDANKASVVVE